jgi:PhzF family phenazine biosynthesis protein
MGPNMNLIRIAAFSDHNQGGNPAGVLIDDVLPEDAEMQRIAAEVGYSETVFAVPVGDACQGRYFLPESEVPFCGHATIALGAALAQQQGDGVFPLRLINTDITVEGNLENGSVFAALQSPPTRSESISDEVLDEVLNLFGYSCDDLDSSLPPARAHGGADHIAITLNSRQALASIQYDLNIGRELMNRTGESSVDLRTWEKSLQGLNSKMELR